MKPTPQLKVRRSSWSATPPVSRSQANTGGSAQAFQSKRGARPSAMARGGFSIRPPPVMWAHALDQARP